MEKISFLFPGQGAQYPGMGKELYDKYEVVRNVLDQVNESVNFDLLNIIFNGPEEELNKTENTQPSILAISFAIYKLLESVGIRPQAMAGLSIGEYSALTASGALQFEDALKLVKKRGRYMQEEVPEGKGSMAAMIGMDREKVISIVKQASDFGTIDAVNFNCPGQIVVAGEIDAIKKAIEIAKSEGSKQAVILPVSAPFHSRLLKGAGEKLNTELNKLSYKIGNIPVIANIDNDYYSFDREEIIGKLTRQVSNPVYFEDIIKKQICEGFNTFIEVGPGKALSNFVKKTDPTVNIFNVHDETSFDNIKRFFEIDSNDKKGGVLHDNYTGK